jgi:hypothetical protein
MISATQSVKFPEAQITNGIIKAKLYLPDTVNGYYRAMRFDWSGVISSLEFKGHEYFGQWFPKYDPLINDAIMGPVEEFTPIGYDDAKPGDKFLKIGVGMLVKPDDSRYTFGKTFEIQNNGVWKTKAKKDQVEFVHQLKNSKYSYDYKKTVRLVKGKPEMVLTHTLKNTGKTTLETDVYNHNFFMIDKAPSGPDLRVKFGFTPSAEFRGPADITQFKGNELSLKRELVNRESIHTAALTGFSERAEDYDIRIENIKTGAGVRITSDVPLSRMVLWANPNTLCPEPYIKFKIEPGQTFSWNIYYEFYTM